MTPEEMATRIAYLEEIMYKFVRPHEYDFANAVRLGMKVSDKVGFYDALPMAQWSDGSETIFQYPIGGSNIQTYDTFDGNYGASRYSIPSLIKGLKKLGLFAK